MLDVSKLVKNDCVIEVYSGSGNLISEKSSSNGGKYVKISELNSYTKNAFIAVEDRRFYSHNGIDFKRILGATFNNLKSLSLKEGASTITQQLIKNTHLSSEKTLRRKLSEIKIAFELEKRYTKDEILELYLNTIYFGKNAYGIESASNVYFNKSASELSINESAMLAGIIKAPSKYSPFENLEASINRKNVVLNSMKECNFITSEDYHRLKNEKIKTATNHSNYFKDYINATLNEYENSNYFLPYSNKKVKITTFLNEDLQRDLNLNKLDKYDLSQIVINSKNGGIIAFYGNNSNLKRSPASCVKPWLVYAPMINDGYIKESSVILDEPINYDGYSPKNYGDNYYGNVTVKTALSKSLNVPAVKLLNGYGIDKCNRYAKKLGVDINLDNLSCALGAIDGGLSLKQLCDTYSPFNNDGNYQKSSFIKEIYIGNEKVYSNNPKKISVFSPETCYIINDVLKDAVNNGNSKKLRSLPYDICAKTGTNGSENGNLDALSVSYTSDVIVGVWVGNEDISLMSNAVTGAKEPTIITKNIYESIYKRSYPNDFTIPNGIIEAKIDETALLKEKTELIKDNGETYYYIKGTEPNKLYENEILPTVINSKINVKNGVITLNFNVKNANSIEIIKEFNNHKTTVYSGDIISNYSENLSGFGIYTYKLKVKGELETVEYKFSSVNYKKDNLEIIKDDKWLTQ